MKKQLCVALSVLMILSNVGVIAETEEQKLEILASEDFDDCDLGNYDSKILSRADYYGYHYNQVVDDEEMESRAFKMINLGYKESGEWTSSTSLNLNGISYMGNVVMEERFKTTDWPRNIIFRLSDGAGNLILPLYVQDAQLRAYDGTTDKIISNYAYNDVVGIRLVLYTDNDVKTDDYYDVYLDGTIACEKLQLPANLDGALTRIQLCEQSFNSNMQETVIDDVKVYKWDEEVNKYLLESQPKYPAETELEKISARSAIIDSQTQKVWCRNEWLSTVNNVFENNYVSLKCLSDAFYAPMEWDEYNKNIIFKYKQREITLTSGSNVVYENNIATEIAEPVRVIGGETKVPISFLNYIGKNTLLKDGRFLIISDFTDEEIAAVPSESLDKLFSGVSEKLTYYVSKSGSNENDGSENAPFAGIEKAKEVIREKIAEGFDGDIDVIIGGGEYFLARPVNFDYRDSVSENHRVRYMSKEGERAIFTKAIRVTDWQEYGNGIYKAKMPEDTLPGMLVENGEYSQVARYPNDDYLNMIACPEAIKTQFKFKPGAFPKVKDTASLEVNLWPGGPQGYWAWWNYTAAVSKISFEENTIWFNGASWSYDLGTGTRYYMQNAIEFLDQPGEFVMDKKNREVYYKPVHLPIEDDNIAIPKKGELFIFKGKGQKALAKNIVLEGLEIRETSKGFDAIKISDSRNITIKDCIIHNTGNDAISIKGYAENNNIIGNRMYDLGLGGVSGTNGSSEEQLTRGNVISDNYINNMGLIIGHGSGVSWSGAESVISHNRIHASKRYAISLKGDQKSSLVGRTIKGVKVTSENVDDYRFTRDNIIEFNDVSDANTESQDSGVIECYGTGTGNIYRNNHIHSSDYYFSLGVGLYFDDGNDNESIYNNIISDLQKRGRGELEAPVCLKGVNNEFKNNVVVNNNAAKGCLMSLQLGEPTRDSTVISNLFCESGDYIYELSSWAKERFKNVDYNLFFNKRGKYLLSGSTRPADNFDEWQKVSGGAYDSNSITENPLFVDADNGDYRVRYDSPAYSIGFNDFDIEGIGLTKDYKYASAEKLEKLYVKASGQKYNQSYVNMKTGAETKLNVSGRLGEAMYYSDLSNANVSYQSQSPAVATVDQNGIVTAKKPGTARIVIEATENGGTAKTTMDILVDDATVKFEPRIMNTVAVEKSSYQIKTFAKTAYNHSYEVPLSNIDILSSDNAIMSVDANKTITAVKPGNAKITLKNRVGGETIAYDYTVQKSPLSKVEAIFDGKIINVGDSTEIAIKGTKENGDAASFEGAKITYSVDDPEKAELLPEGDKVKVTLKKDGIVKLEAKVEADNKEVTSSTYICARPSDTRLKPGWKLVNGMEADGFATFDDDKLSLCTNGLNVWGTSDDYTYVYKDSGAEKSEISISVDSLKDIGVFDTAFGPMFRVNDEDTSYFMTIRVLPSGATRVVYRNSAKPSCGYKAGPEMTFPAELKLVKNGKTVSAYAKVDGEWQKIDSQDIEGLDGGSCCIGVAGMAAASKAATLSEISKIKITE